MNQTEQLPNVFNVRDLRDAYRLELKKLTEKRMAVLKNIRALDKVLANEGVNEREVGLPVSPQG